MQGCMSLPTRRRREHCSEWDLQGGTSASSSSPVRQVMQEIGMQQLELLCGCFQPKILLWPAAGRGELVSPRVELGMSWPIGEFTHLSPLSKPSGTGLP